MAGKPRPLIITEKDRRIAAAVVAGKEPIYQILIGEGVKPSTAQKGQAALTKGVKAAIIQMRGKHYQAVGQELLNDPVAVEHHVMGFLYESTLERTNKGVTAAKLMGQHRRIDMFTSDAQQNVLVIASPSDWKQPERPLQPLEQPKALPPADAEPPEYE